MTKTFSLINTPLQRGGLCDLTRLNRLTGSPPSPPREERVGERRPVHAQVHAGEPNSTNDLRTSTSVDSDTSSPPENPSFLRFLVFFSGGVREKTDSKPRARTPFPPIPFTHNRGFTLLELLVVIAVVALFALLLVPARADSRTKSQSATCLSNLKQIMAGMLMYTHDDHDMFPPNPDDGTTTPGYTWCTGQASIGGRDEFNPDLMKDPARNLLTRYTGTNVNVYRCTADTRVGVYDGAYLYPASPLIGKRIPAARTISISQAVGVIDPGFAAGGAHSGIPTLPTNGPWLTGSHGANNANTGPYRTYGRTSQVIVPTPAQLFVVTEEERLSLNDGSLAVSVGTPLWVDFPSTLHNMACAIAFADGHTELHKWSNPKMRLTSGFQVPVTSGDVDWSWLSTRTSAKVQ